MSRMRTMPSSRAVAPSAGGFRLLRGSLVAGALYDFCFAAIMIGAPALATEPLRLPLPGETFYLRVLAVLLGIVGSVYLIAARDPHRNRALVAIAIAGRFGGFLAFASAAIGRTDLAGLWIVGGGDLAFSLLHLTASRGLWR